MQPFTYNQCLTQLQQRTRQLRDYQLGRALT
jgi:hypothetical protein